MFAAAALLLAAGLAAAPTAGEAAQWWKFGRDKPQSEDARSPGAISVAQSDEGSDRMSRLENSLRNLTGQVEQLTFQLRQLQEQVKRAQEDNEFRFQDLENGKGGAGKKAVKAEPPAAQQPSAAASEQPPAAEPPAQRASEEPPPAAEGQAGADGTVLGAPPKSIGTLITDEPPPPGSQPMDLSTMSGGGAEQTPAPAQQTASLPASGDPATDFKAAYEQIVRGDYAVAEAAFRQFLANYPGDPRAAEAQYWIGDSLFSRGKYGEAAAEFRTAYKKYPQSTKGAETLLKIGMSATATEDFASACKIYAQLLKQYPQASNALRQRVKVEQASAGC
jgi:tol-pal system protein YbgF